jgi:glycosyltransferase involved in cell wall biosynthesis
MTVPAVSIVVPCYNGGRFLDGLLASLSAQTFRDFEIIIVDDGSSDNATREKLASIDAAIRVIRQENRGLPSARNTGFRLARAAFVLPLDSDDGLEPAFLAEMTTALRAAPPSVGFAFADVRLTGTVEGVLPRRLNRFDQLFLNHLPYCMLVRKSAWEAVGGYDETMRDGAEDWEFNIRLVRAGFSGIGIAKPMFVYRVSPEGMLMSRAARMHGTLWQRIREKHRELYRLSALIALWRATRQNPSSVSPLRAAGLLAAAKLLPGSWFNAIFYRLLAANHARHIATGEWRAGQRPQVFSASPLAKR